LAADHGTVAPGAPGAPAAPAAVTAPAQRSYASGARILSIGIAATGLFSFAYFSVASHVLTDTAYGGVNLLWTILFITISVIYRPVEQLLSRTIATRRAQGHEGGHPLRTAAMIQVGFAAAFLVIALALKGVIVDAFDGAGALFWILIAGVLAYAASYFARGYLAGHQWFGLYGGLVFFEAVSRFAFPVAVAVGALSGQTAVALGIAAAPFASLLVIPWALRRATAAAGATADRVAAAEAAARAEAVEVAAGQAEGVEAPSRATEAAQAGTAFAVAVALIQLSEQTLLNAAVLLVPSGKTVAVVFSAFLITRAPLQLFQAIQTSLLPHLAGLEATEGREGFAKAIRITVLTIAAFAALVAVGLALLGPFAMGKLFAVDKDYAALGLATIAVGMGFHLTAGTFNQAALARGRAGLAAAAWLTSAAAFVAWMAAEVVTDALTRAETGYAGATALLCALLYALYRA
jgi:O-antigen/teichoic acid export membrane protein